MALDQGIDGHPYSFHQESSLMELSQNDRSLLSTLCCLKAADIRVKLMRGYPLESGEYRQLDSFNRELMASYAVRLEDLAFKLIEG